MAISPDPSRAELKYLVERQREEIQTILAVGRLAGSATDPYELIRRVASYLNQTFPVSLCAFLLLGPRSVRVIPFSRATQMDLTSVRHRIVTEPGPGFPGGLDEEKFQLEVEEPAGNQAPWAQAPAGALRSAFMAPLTFNETLLGRLAVFSVKDTAFPEEDCRVIRTVADQLAAALRNAFLVEELKKADAMKTDLLAIISHELRIPLTSILEGSSMLLEGVCGQLSEEQLDMTNTVRKGGERLLGLIEETELAAQLITNKLNPQPQTVNLAELLAEIIEGLKEVWAPRNVQVAVSGGPVSAKGDRRYLKHALRQIVENAIQASPDAGTVSVALSKSSSSAVVQVGDTGKGIPAEFLKDPDQLFRQSGPNERKTGGLGLGLFIAKKVLDAHKGSLSIESKPGEGTRATLQLPLAEGAA